MGVLVEMGTRVDDSDFDGFTALHFVCDTLVSPDFIYELMEHGADPRVLTTTGKENAVDIMKHGWDCCSEWPKHQLYFERALAFLDKKSAELDERDRRDAAWIRRRDVALVLHSHGKNRTTGDPEGAEAEGEGGGIKGPKKMVEDLRVLRHIMDAGVTGEGQVLVPSWAGRGKFILQFV